LRKQCEENRSNWYRATVGTITKAHRAYEEAIRGVAEAREALADEVALHDWIMGGAGASPILDTLGTQNGRESLSFTRVLQSLSEDAEQVATHLPEPQPRMPWSLIKGRVEALQTQGLSREEALHQTSSEWGGD
jgi:hypothetical protein